MILIAPNGESRAMSPALRRAPSTLAVGQTANKQKTKWAVRQMLRCAPSPKARIVRRATTSAIPCIYAVEAEKLEDMMD